jgi:hypothetical protein
MTKRYLHLTEAFLHILHSYNFPKTDSLQFPSFNLFPDQFKLKFINQHSKGEVLKFGKNELN